MSANPQLRRTVREIHAACMRAIRKGQWEQAMAGFARLLPLLENAGDHLGMARARLQMAQVAEQVGDFPQAREHCRQAESAARTVNDRRLQAAALHRLGHLTRMDDPPAARELFRDVLALDSGDREADALSLAMIGQIDFTEGDREGGLKRMIEALVRMPAAAPNREHLIEHVMYFGGRIERARYERLVRDGVPHADLARRLRGESQP